MTFKVVMLQSAQTDLKTLRHYIIKQFSASAWQATYEHLKSSIRMLAELPHPGSIPDELQALSLNHFRQMVSGLNRIIYEIRSQTVYVHIIVDSRKSLQLLLTQRLLRAEFYR